MCLLAALFTLPTVVFGQQIQTPAETACADAVYAGHLAQTLSDLALKYTGTTRWARPDIETLCRGTRASQEPPTCFANAMVSDADWSTGQQLRWDLALQLCAGTNQASQTIGCFDVEKRQVRQSRPGEMTDIEIWRGAVEKCHRRPGGAADPGQQTTFQQQPVSPPQPEGQPTVQQPDPNQELLDRLKALEEKNKLLEDKARQEAIQATVAPEIKDDIANIEDLLGVTEFAFEAYDKLMKGEPRQYRLQDRIAMLPEGEIEPDARYTVTAVCDKNCKDIDLILLDSEGRQVLSAKDKGPDAKPVVEIPLGTSSQYSAQVMMQDCSAQPCSFALLVVKDQTAFAVTALPRFQKTSPPKPPIPTVNVGPGKPVPPPPPLKPVPDPPVPVVKSGVLQMPTSVTGVTYKTRAQISKSTLPIVQNTEHCVFLATNYIPWDYGNGKWPAGEAERLCSGTSNSVEPPRCYYKAMHESGPHPDNFTDWTPEVAMRLCAGATRGNPSVATANADARIRCFAWELAKEAHISDDKRNLTYWPRGGEKIPWKRNQFGIGTSRWDWALGQCENERTRKKEPGISPGSDEEADVLAVIRPGWEMVQECVKGVGRDVPSEKWDVVKARKLCTGTRFPKEPKECFVALTLQHGKQPAEAIEMCAGTNDADATVNCVARRRLNAVWVKRTNSCRGNPAHWPEPTSR